MFLKIFFLDCIMEREETAHSLSLEPQPTVYDERISIDCYKVNGEGLLEQQNNSNSSSSTDTIDSSVEKHELEIVNSSNSTNSNQLVTTNGDSFLNPESNINRKSEISSDIDSTSILKRKLSEIYQDANSIALASPQYKKPRTEDIDGEVVLGRLEKSDNVPPTGVFANCVQSGGLQTWLNPKAFKNTDEMTYFLKHQLQFSDLGKLFGNVEMTTDNDPLKEFEYAQYLGLQPSVKFKCFKCSDSNFTSLSELKQHQNICLKGEKAPCENLPDLSKNRRIVDEEVLNETTKAIQMDAQIRITRKVFLCSACGTYYENWNLFHHIREVHKRFICLLCLGIFPSSERLVNHLEVKHATKPDIYEQKQQLLDTIRDQCYLMCCVCEHIFCESDDFTNHSCENYIQPCSLCGLKFIHKPNCKATVSVYNKMVKHKKSTNKHRKTVAPNPTNQSADMNGSDNVACEPPQVVSDIIGQSNGNGEKSKHSIIESTPSKESTFDLQLQSELNDFEKLQSELCTGSSQTTVNNNHHQNDSSSSQISSILKQEFGGPPISLDDLDIVVNGYINTDLMSSPKNNQLNEEPIHENGNIDDDEDDNNRSFNQTDSSRSPSPLPIIEEKPLLVPKLKLNLKNVQAPIESEESSTESDDDDICNADDDQDESQQQQDDVQPFESREEEIVTNDDMALNDSQMDEVNVEEEDEDEEIEQKYVPNTPSDGIDVASDDVVAVDLLLHQPLDKIPIRDFLRICLKNTYPLCLYCNHARKISVDGNSLALHLVGTHRFAATVDSITAEELLPDTIVHRIKSSLDELNGIYFNLDSYDSADKEFTIPYEKQYECFQCRFQSRIHKDLYLHNRKMHLKTVIMCLMCKSNFYSYSELVCHMCPGSNKKLVPFELKFRCVLCNLDNIPSAFRLMVHLRKKHFACDVCLEECYDQSKLSSHVWKHKLHHLCYRCGIAYRNKPDITKHLFWKHGTESVLCKRCLHKKWPHVYHFCIPPSSFDCEICGMSFSKAVALKVHKRIHSEDAPYPCTEDGCEKKFISRKLLLKHVARHYMPIEEIKQEVISVKQEGIEEEPPIPEDIVTEQSIVTEVEDKKKIKKIKKPKTARDSSKNLMDIIDLPAPNLSESDSSEESDNDRTTIPTSIPAFISTSADVDKIQDDPVIQNIEDDEVKPPPPVYDIWENFKSYQASQIQKQSFDEDEIEIEIVPPPILHVVQSDHDYCSMYKPFIEKQKEIKIDSPRAIESIEQTLINITEGEKPVIIEQAQQIHQLKAVQMKSPEKLSPKKGFSPKKCLPNTKSDSSSSSDSDSSCSCGSNCSCSTSSSGSSSSSSSDSDSSSSEGRRKLELKKVLKQERRDRVKSENANLSDNIDVVNTDKPEEKVTNDPDSIIFESDLETDESETDEDFYDEHPQRLANQMLAEKRKQLMMQTCLSPMNSFDIIENSRPSTPSLPEEMIKEKKVKVKKRKKDRKSSKNVPSLKLNIPLKLIELPSEIDEHVDMPIPSPFNLSSIETNKIKQLSTATPKINKQHTPGVIKSNNVSRLSTGSSCSDIETPLKRSQRRRIPNKFYGYNSDEESNDMLSSNPFKPTPPPNLTWRKEDLPQTPTIVRTPPIKTVIKLPTATNFKLTQPDHHPPAQLFESKAFITPKPLPPHKLFQQSNQPPPIPPIIIRPNRIQQQPPRVEPLRVPAVPVHHIAAPQISQDSEQSADSSDSESSDDNRTLQITPQQPLPTVPPPPIPINFQSNQIRYPIMPPAGCRPAREGESVYCYCRCPYDEVSEMIACDGSDCAIEWFHFECVNIMVPPKGTWYCPQCRPKYINESQPMYEGIT